MARGRSDIWRAERWLAAGMSAAAMVFGSPSFAFEPSDSGAADALRGPSVGEKLLSRSLVERDFSGKLKRLEVDPAIAAIEHIELTPDERAKVDRLINERNTLMDGLVLDHLKDIVALAGARQAGDRAGTRESLVRVYEEFRPFIERGTLSKELKSALPEAKYAELERMTREYGEAAMGERESEMNGENTQGAAAGAGGKRFAGRGGAGKEGAGAARAQEFLEGFGQEIKRSYERVLGSRAKDFDALLASLSLRPEQESKVRGLVTDLIQKSLGKPSPRETARVYMQVYRELDAEQRAALVRTIRERRGEPKKDEGAGQTAKP